MSVTRPALRYFLEAVDELGRRVMAKESDMSDPVLDPATTPNPTPARRTWAGRDIAYTVHVALRKCCDSTVTSLLWNLVHAMQDGDSVDRAWDWYCAGVAERLNGGARPVAALQWILTGAGDRPWPGPDLPSTAQDVLQRRVDRHGASVIRLTLSLFSREDWAGMASYLELFGGPQ